MSEQTAVAKANPRAELRTTLTRYADKLAVFGVNPDAYIEAALMAVVKVPDLLKCSPESIALALRQCAQTGLEIGRTAHLLPYGSTCTFVPDYKGLIELATATGKVASIRVREVYEGEEFFYGETISGPDLRHTPRLSGSGGKIVGAYAIADLRFNRFKVEWMTAEEIDAIRKEKSKSWKNGPLTGWYARKTVVRRLCKTLPSNAKLQQALRFDDTEDGTGIEDAQVVQQPIAFAKGKTINPDPYPVSETAVTPEENAASLARIRERIAKEGMPNPYDLEELPGSLPFRTEEAA